MVPWQANYAAANAAADAAITAGWTAGWVGVSVQWGPWALPGGMASAVTLQFAQERGIGVLAPGVGLQCLTAMLARSTPQSVWVDQTLYKDATSPVIVASPLSESFVAERNCEVSNGDAVAVVKLDRQLGSIDTSVPAAVDASGGLVINGKGLTQPAVRAAVSGAVARVVGAEVDDSAPLMDAGLDSLGALDVKDQVEQALKVWAL